MAPVAAILLWAVASPVAAQTVNATYLSNIPIASTVMRTIMTGPGAPQSATSLSVGRFDIQYNSGTMANTFVGSGVPGRFYAFCIEPRQAINVNVAVSYDFVSLDQGTTNIGGMGATKAGLIAELFGRWAPQMDASMTTLQAGALQVAIWEIVREVSGNPLDVLNGNIFFATPESTAGTIALAQSYVQSLTGRVGLQVGSTRALCRIKKLTADSGKGLTDAMIFDALGRFPAGRGPTVCFMTQRSLMQLQKSRTPTTNTAIKGTMAEYPRTIIGVDGQEIPILVTDALLNTEALTR